jgi:alkaline phosphatase D
VTSPSEFDAPETGSTHSRRDVLRTFGIAGLGLAAAPLLRPTPSSQVPADLAAPTITSIDDRDVFPSGVASGDPTETGAILWTRVEPDRIDGRTPLFVEIATDESFGDVVVRRVVAPADVDPTHDGTVRVDVDGLLTADRFWFFRFTYGEAGSRTGRCRTTPAKGAPTDGLRFGIFSCSNYPAGFFNGYRLAMEDDLDYVIHVGDFIYENASTGGSTGRAVVLPSGERVMSSLEDCYAVHRTYRTDPDLQDLLAWHTLIATWDDHETVNNPFYDYDTDAPGSGSHPRGSDPEFMRRFFLEAATAYHDYLPMRVTLDLTPGLPLHEAWRLYRTVSFGDLLDLFMLDGRWYRTRQPATGTENVEGTSDRSASEDGFMLAPTQLEWLTTGLRESTAQWRVLGNQTIFQPWGAMLPGPGRVYINMDAWDGYRAERNEIMAAFAERPTNNLVLTGDMHAFVWGYLQDAYGVEGVASGNRVAYEIMTSSVTSTGLFFFAEQTPGMEEALEATQFALNPHMQLFNWTRHGYVRLDITPEAATATAVITGLGRGEDTKRTYQTVRIPDGVMEAEVVERNSASGVLPATTPVPPVPAATLRAEHAAQAIDVGSWDALEVLLNRSMGERA